MMMFIRRVARSFPRTRTWLAALVERDALDRAMDDEFALHLELRTNEWVRRGLSPADAAGRARLEFGNVTAAKETARAAWGAAWTDDLRQDLRFALRSLRLHRAFAVVAILSLGAGIGAATTMFSVIDALDVRPLPYENANRLVWLAEVTPPDHPMCSRCSFLTSRSTARDWASESHAFDAIASVGGGGLSWEHDDIVEGLGGNVVSPGFFRLLGTRPIRGRDFVADDTVAGAPLVAIVSYQFWHERLGGDARAVGRALMTRENPGSANLRPVTIIGVLPSSFRFRDNVAVWLPLRSRGTDRRTARVLTVIGRLRPDASIDQAIAELRTIDARLGLADPAAFRGWGTTVEPLRTLLIGSAGTSRFVLFAITMLVLVIAVLNVTGLLTSRAAAREPEFKLRSALGAGRSRLIRQVLVEGGCIGLSGGGMGAALAFWAVRFPSRWFAIDATGLATELDIRVLIFAVTVAVVAGVGAALAPAVRAAAATTRGPARRDDGLRARFGDRLSARERAGDRPATAARTSNALITAQIALALVVLTTAAHLSRDFLALRFLDVGYDPRGLHATSINSVGGAGVDLGAWRVMAEDARARVAAIPGVLSASLNYRSAIHPEIVRPDNAMAASVASATGGAATSLAPGLEAVDGPYFATFGTRVTKGRSFGNTDIAGAPPVAVVNDAAARVFWPGLDPTGHHVAVGDSGGREEILTVVGVVSTAERGDRIERGWPVVYRPLAQAHVYHPAATLYVRTSRDARAILAAAEAVIRQTTGRAAAPFRSEEDAIDMRYRTRQFNAVALDLFGLFGLLLAAMGIYGSVAYAVTQRSREIGIRVALGASRERVVLMIARRGVALAIAGVVLGTAGAIVITRIITSRLVGASGTNPWMYAGSIVLMIAVALLATLVPARRATRVDPMVALRGE